MPAPDKFSDFISLAALLMSAVSLYISYRHYYRDAGRLRLTLRFDASSSHGDSYTLTITNVGRRPVSLVKVYARFQNGKRYEVFNTISVLTETVSRDILIPMAGFENVPPLSLRAFEIHDSSGRTYVARTWKLWWQIRKHAAKRIHELN